MLSSVLVAVAIFGCASTDSVRQQYVEGLHYQRLDPALPTSSGAGRIEVVELFLYACPHCRELEPRLLQWLEGKSEYVDFRPLPAIVGPPWADQARAFYTAEKLGVLDTAHSALFESIHRDGKRYASDQSVMEFFVGQGIAPEDFVSAYHSPEVDGKVSQARVMTVRYGIRGVPAVVINGKYVTAQYFTGTQEAMLEVVDMLVERERAEMTAGAGPG
jgi:thiol:disulfide interchange protein DsbA